MIATRNEGIDVYLGSFEESIQDLGQFGVCVNSKLDVLQGTNNYVVVQDELLAMCMTNNMHCIFA